MIRVESKKALEVIANLQEITGETVAIFKGVPDARFKNEYHAFCVTWQGFQACGTYGKYIASSKTLIGLVEECKGIVFRG